MKFDKDKSCNLNAYEMRYSLASIGRQCFQSNKIAHTLQYEYIQFSTCVECVQASS